MHKVFISGSMSIYNLDKNVLDRLSNVIAPDYQVLVGDANGVDSAVQKQLMLHNSLSVIVYCAGDEPRNNFGNWTVERVFTAAKQGTREFFTAKDVKMAEACDYGFMIWDTKSTGTLRNVIELLGRGKYSLVYVNKKKMFRKVKSVYDLEDLLKDMSETSLKKADEKLKLRYRIGELKNIQPNLI